MNTYSNSISLWCMITAILALGIPGCSGKQEEEEKPKYSAADDSEQSFDKEMMDKLNELGSLESMERQARTPEERLEINQKKTELATELLKNENLTEQFRAACVMAKAQSLLKRIALEDKPEGLREELWSFTNEILSDTNPEVSRIAKTSRVSLLAADLINNKLDNKDELIAGLVELVDMYPDHPVAAREVFGLVERLWNTEHRNVAVQVMRQILPVLIRNTNEVNEKIVPICQSRIRLDSHKYPSAVEKQLNSSSEVTKEFKDAVSSALADPEFTEIMYGEVAKAIRELEIKNQYQALLYLYAQIKQKLSSSPNEKLKKQALEDAEKGIQRISLINKPFKIIAENIEGNPVDLQPFNGKPLIVVFISVNSQPNLNALGYLEAVHNELGDQGVNMLVACIDVNRRAITQTFANSKGKWIAALNPSDDSKPKLADAFGIQQLPFVLLVSSKGLVTEINIPPSDVKDKVQQLLFSNLTDRRRDVQFASVPKHSSQIYLLATLFASPVIADISLLEAPRISIQQDQDETTTNAYIAPAHFKTKELVDYLLGLDDKPRSIQNRDSFVDAIHDTASRILDDKDSKGAWKRIAALTCAKHLQAKAALGEDNAQQKLVAWTARIKNIENKAVQNEVEFLQLEQQLLEADKIGFEEIDGLLEKSRLYCEANELEQKHLRLASLTVQLINRIDRKSNTEEDAKTRTKYFETFGELFAKSDDKRLARYGKSLAKTSSASSSNWIGKPLKLAGTNLSGVAMDWDSYRGKVVLVDFWATWCGPCRKSIPEIADLYNQLRDSGFEVVGVNLDADPETARKYTEENAMNWENLGGEEAKNAAENYGVSAIPTLMVIDPEGNIVAVDHKLAKIKPQITKLLEDLKKR